MKRYFTLTIISLIVLTIFTACSGKKDSSGSSVEKTSGVASSPSSSGNSPKHGVKANGPIGSWKSSGKGFDTKVIAFGDGTFVAGGSDGLGFSTDGINWTNIPSRETISSMAYGNGTFVTNRGTAGVTYSTDKGKNWKVEFGKLKGGQVISSGYALPDGNVVSVETAEGIFNVTSVVFGNGIFVAAGGSEGKVAHSTDGINWTLVSLIDISYPYLVYGNGTFIATGEKFIKENDKDFFAKKFFQSTDGVNWKDVGEHPLYRMSIDTIAFGGGTFIAAGYDSHWNEKYETVYERKIIYSTDGLNWTGVDTDIDIRNITYGNGTFIATCETNYYDEKKDEKIYFTKIIYSTDNGRSWQTAMDLDPDLSIQAFAYGNGAFVAATWKENDDNCGWLYSTGH